MAFILQSPGVNFLSVSNRTAEDESTYVDSGVRACDVRIFMM